MIVCMTTIEALTSDTGSNEITVENGWNVYRFDNEEDHSQQTLLGTFGTEPQAMTYARRNGGHQVQLGVDGDVINVQTGDLAEVR